jgi:hypothetical protein
MPTCTDVGKGVFFSLGKALLGVEPIFFQDNIYTRLGRALCGQKLYLHS